MDKPIILAHNIQKTFRNGKIEVHALRGVDLSIASGEMVAVMGQAIIGQLFSVITAGRTLAVPWSQIGIIVLAAYLFSLLTTILPAMQASRIYPADALRYE